MALVNKGFELDEYDLLDINGSVCYGLPRGRQSTWKDVAVHYLPVQLVGDDFTEESTKPVFRTKSLPETMLSPDLSAFMVWEYESCFRKRCSKQIKTLNKIKKERRKSVKHRHREDVRIPDDVYDMPEINRCLWCDKQLIEVSTNFCSRLCRVYYKDEDEGFMWW